MNKLSNEFLESLAAQPVYFPVERGVFEMAPGLFPLSTDFGNGALDQKLFQLSINFPKYRANKLASRSARLEQYFQRQEFSPSLEREICSLIIERLLLEWPQFFMRETLGGINFLHAKLSAETLAFSLEGDYLSGHSKVHATPAYQSGFDALASQVAEDLNFMVRDSKLGTNKLVAIHLCAPEGWSAEEKIGMSFEQIHVPVPDIERINRRADAMMELMINKGPFTRFVWGLNGDNNLNHHPQVRNKSDRLGENRPARFLRVEKQVTWGLPKIDATLFTIGVHFYALEDLAQGAQGKERMELLRRAILSMSDAHLAYRSMPREVRDLILSQLPTV